MSDSSARPPQPSGQPWGPPRRRGGFWRGLGLVVLVGLAIVGGLSLLLFAGIAAMVAALRPDAATVPERVLLTFDFATPIVEALPDDPLLRFELSDAVEFAALVQALERAATDPRVIGFAARVDGSALGIAQVEELREAVAALAAAGKPTYAFAESFGELSAGTLDYYLATGFAEIWLQPSGGVAVTGVALEQPFFAGTMEWLEVQPRIAQRQEYKAAAESFTNAAFSAPARLSLQRLVDSMVARIADGIAAARPGAGPVRALIDGAPYGAAEAAARGLVERLGYRDELDAMIDEHLQSPARLDLAAYAVATEPAPSLGTPQVALIRGAGIIVSGETEPGPAGLALLGAATLEHALAAAIDDPAIAAIVLRIDSPGGSYRASDVVWRQVARARAAGKPVVVSMGNLAASGSYFIAMGADHIVAQPTTITGSIGVYAGKFVLDRLYERFGITWDGVSAGANAGMWSDVRDFTPAQWDSFNAELDRIYGDFVAKAAQGRGVSEAEIEPVARGRVWTGADALERGLVDELGGLATALRWVRARLGLAADAPLQLVPLPRPKDPFEALLDWLGGAPGGSVRGFGEAGAGAMAWPLLAREPGLAALLAAGAAGDAALLLPPLRLQY